MTIKHAITDYLGAFVDELVRVGVRNVVVSPGSRSTPIALLMAEHPEMKVWMNIDERSAGFFALGMAKAMKKPVALLCTSGTAAANYLPAVVEAFQARVPLIVLTADRPHELRDVGAPQTINQIGIFGSQVKWFVEMAIPESDATMLRYIRTTADRAATVALSSPCGPVHLNFPLREPLLPQLPTPTTWSEGREDGQRYVYISVGQRQLNEHEIRQIALDLSNVSHGLIICGPQDDLELAEAVSCLAEKLQFPILADPLSQLRSGSHDKKWIVDGYDGFLRDETVVRHYSPEVIIRFGAMPVSKALLQYINNHPSCRQMIVDEGGGWREPTLMASTMLYTDASLLCHSLCETLESMDIHIPVQSDWSRKWLELNNATKQYLQKRDRFEELFEGQLFIELTDCLPTHTTLFVGNSMPVRDLDTFFSNNDLSVRIMANRGANGIDGVVSSALGVSATGTPTVLVIGDLSFFHDLNGLLAAKMHGLNITIVIVNNDGGGIFSFLPQAGVPTHFEQLFGTPTGLDFKHAVTMYGGTFTRIESWEAFRTEVKQAMSSSGLKVIEVPPNRERNVSMHREVWQDISKTIENEIREGI